MTDGENVETSADFGGRRARFRQYDSPAAVEAYLQRLEDGWPERAEIAEHIAKQIANQIAPWGVAAPTILELCCGPGRLAHTLLQRLPAIRYTGIDLSQPFLAFAQERLRSESTRATFVETDLSDPQWPLTLVPNPTENQGNRADAINGGRFHAIISMQSLHDVGDEAMIARIYQQAKQLLMPGGFFLNADLVVAEGEDLPKNPGRRSIIRHLELLVAAGYAGPRCTLARSGFGCVLGWNR